jgi:hypothetical protein
MPVAFWLVAARLVHLDAWQRRDASPATNQDMDPIVSPALQPIQFERGTGTQCCSRACVEQGRPAPLQTGQRAVVQDDHERPTRGPTSSEQLRTNLVLCHADGGKLIAAYDVGLTIRKVVERVAGGEYRGTQQGNGHRHEKSVS